jgi:hypothetical protein
MRPIVKLLATLAQALTAGQDTQLHTDANGNLWVTGTTGGDASAAKQDALSAQIPAALGPTTPAASLSTVQALSAAIVTGQKAVTTSVAALATTATYKNGIKLTNLSTSASSIFYGPSGVSATTGDELPVGQSVVLPLADPALIFVITASGTATATFAGLS